MTVKLTKSATATKHYTFSKLANPNAVQAFYIGSTYIYALQRINDTNSIMTRCTVEGNIAERKDDMLLKRFGHGETLQYFSHGGQDYWWVGCKGVKTTSKDIYWAQQLARLQYKANTEVDYTDVKRISSLNHASKSGTCFTATTRFEAALSSSAVTTSGVQELLIMTINDSTPRTAHFTAYDNEKLNNLLDKSGTVYTSAADLTSAVVTDFPLTSIYGKVPYESIQGIEYSNGRAIYFTSGDKSVITGISKRLWGSSATTVGAAVSDGPVGITETEGIQLKGDDIFFVTSHYTNGSVDANYIYSIPKSVF